MFQLLGFKSDKGYQRTSILIESHLEEQYIRIENYFPSLTIQVYDWMRDPYSESAGHPENFTLKEELWAAVCSYTQDKIYILISGRVQDFCERRVSYYS